MRLAVVCLLLATMVPPGGQGSTSGPVAGSKPAYTPTSGYEDRQIEGWTVRIHKDLLEPQHAALLEDALAELRSQLFHARRAVPETAVQRLRTVVFWLELRNPKQDNGCYHPSRQWLVEHGYNPQKARGIEFGSAAVFLNYARSQPWMVLHELAHAYHDQVLGWGHPKVKAAYQAAKDSGRYEKVLLYNGRTVRHYAMNNEKEYFAEASEAYFGTNDFYPFVRAELKEHDPNMHALTEEVWGRRQGPGGAKGAAPAPAPEAPRARG